VSLDLELEIEPGPQVGSYSITVHRSPAGETSTVNELDVADLLARRPALQASVLASAEGASSHGGGVIRDVGLTLFRALFSGPVYGRYTAAVAAAADRGEPLRIVLRLRAPELAAVAWEALLDPETEEYVCQQEPLVRHVQSPKAANPLTVPAPLRVLGVVAAPKDLAPIDVAEEKRRVSEALAETVRDGRVVLDWVASGTWADVQDRLLNDVWHVLHFVGHGGYDPAADEGVLALVGDNGNADFVGAKRFATLLHTARPVPRLIVLNTCASGESGVDDLFSSTAAALVRSGVTAVVAMQFVISDRAAIAFSRGMYAAIAQNRALDEAVRIGRIEILGTSSHTLEWITPVVYLRTPQATLFSLTPAPPAPPGSWFSRHRRLVRGLGGVAALALVAASLVWVFRPDDSSCGAVSDGFDSTSLGQGWEERNGGEVEVFDGRLTVTAADGADIRVDLQGDVTAPWVARPVTDSFAVETSLTVDPRFTYQGAGLLLYRDGDNYVRLERGFGSVDAIVLEYAADGRHLKVHGPFEGENVVSTSATNVELRLVRNGSDVSASWRPTGSDDWRGLGGSIALEGDADVGVTVLNRAQPPSGDPLMQPLTASFDRVSIRCG